MALPIVYNSSNAMQALQGKRQRTEIRRDWRENPWTLGPLNPQRLKDSLARAEELGKERSTVESWGTLEVHWRRNYRSYSLHTGNTITAHQPERQWFMQRGRGLSSTAVAISCANTSEVDLNRSCRCHALNNTLYTSFNYNFSGSGKSH